MQEKKKQYILDDLLRIILAMFVLTVLFAFSCLLLSHGARGIWLAVLAQFTLLGVLGGVFLRRCLRIVQKNEQVMQLYAAGYTIADICHLKCYFSRGTEMALKKAVALLDTGKLLSVSKRQAQYLALQNQINPHFLYNTLDAIIWLAEAGEQKRVVGMVRNLSDFFRTSLNQGKDINSIKEEMLHVKSYLEIQHVRYQDILSYDIEVPEALYIYSIPKITIQPLVENALYHGIKNKRGMGHISIRGEAGEKDFTITVTDDGIGIDETRLRQVQSGIQNKVLTGKDFYGIYNVCERIRLNFGEEYGIFIESVYGEGTSVRVILPYVEAK